MLYEVITFIKTFRPPSTRSHNKTRRVVAGQVSVISPDPLSLMQPKDKTRLQERIQ